MYELVQQTWAAVLHLDVAEILDDSCFFERELTHQTTNLWYTSFYLLRNCFTITVGGDSVCAIRATEYYIKYRVPNG